MVERVANFVNFCSFILIQVYFPSFFLLLVGVFARLDCEMCF